MYPDGTKKFHIEAERIKLFLHPYFYMMIDHFFREGMPVYALDSVDKPNEYTLDYEDYPKISAKLKIQDSLICFANTE
jgi:hypothetical protein